MKYYFTMFVLISPALPLSILAERVDRRAFTWARAACHIVGSVVLACFVIILFGAMILDR